ncbi:MAG: heavy metal translocating P-type ATPase [Bacillus sp. (in: Bacteria)]|nr:heavy metal translocating P-type ATPase [Bacillus sp. (in: firmicutes)]MCM1425757.1 heavy metal translocating P-type ATPase [Eubacterium sp.]
MEQYTVTGMSCAACSTRVEKAVSGVNGVTSCSVSLLTNSMGVEGTASAEAIIAAVEAAGYGASKKGAGVSKARENAHGTPDYEDMLADKETPVLQKRMIISLCLLLPLMYFSMGHMMWGWPIPAFFEGNHVAMGLLQLLLTIAIMLINRKFFVSGAKSVMHGAPNMDTLVAMGAGASFIYSVYALFAMTDAQVKNDMAAVMEYMDEFYFESAATILTLITVGKMLEARSKGKTTDALKGLMKLAPKKATLIRDGKEIEVDIAQVKKDDEFVVRPGENIPVDGIVIDGISAVNEAALTGESIPVDKQAGDNVSAATLNQSGFLKCRATRVGEDTTLSQIIQMVSDAAATKAPIAKVADKVSGIFVPAVIAIAVLTGAVWLLAGEGFAFALGRAISVLVISCPCALGLATPVAIMVGNGMGAKNGIMFKTAQSLELTGKMQIAALDKTGTITSGEPEVTDIAPAGGCTEDNLLALACALEQKSEHPLAKAVLEMAKEKGIAAKAAEDFAAVPGKGLTGFLDKKELAGGNLEFIQTKAKVPQEMIDRAGQFAQDGKTPLFFSRANVFQGIIAVADVIKKDSARAVAELQNMGIKVVMLTGDNERTARAIGEQAGVDEVIAGVLPDGKESVIRDLQKRGAVVMVGDGINDAPALTRADIGIAIGAGTDIAIDAADIVLMKSRLSDVPAAIRLSRATLKNIHENLFWAFFYNVIGIPLAAGLWYPILGWKLNPMFAAAAMSLSSFCVVSNALRLNLFRMYSTKHDRKMKRKLHKKDGQQTENQQIECQKIEKRQTGNQPIENQLIKEKESKNMEKTMEIKGMMCGHCEAAVKKALEELPEVKEALVSHEKGNALVTLQSEVADDVLKKTVEALDYEVVSIA